MNAFTIAIDPLNWGMKSAAEFSRHIPTMRLVLESAASQIGRHCGGAFMPDIVVHHRKEGPFCFFAKDARGRIKIGLNTTHAKWSQQALQFAHEFCHAVADHSRSGQRLDAIHENKWLEESICHTASIFAIRRMSEEWTTHSKFKGWTGKDNSGTQQPYFDLLWQYAQDEIDKAMVLLPVSENFASWLKRREPELRARPVANEKDSVKKTWIRDSYDVIASRLLPVFEQSPSGWDSVSFLNLTAPGIDKPLAQHLADWQQACPDHLRSFVGTVASLFHIPVPPPK